jgi:RNA polymerase sigma-70 factor (ECF subfamily)
VSQDKDNAFNKDHRFEKYSPENQKDRSVENPGKHPQESSIESSIEAIEILAIQQTLQGNKNAFSTIIERYTPLLYSLAYRMLGSHEEAEEAVQEIFLRVYRSLGKFRLSERFHPWIYTIALNFLRSNLRRRGRKIKYESQGFDDLESIAATKDYEKDPARQFEEREAERVAQRAIMSLRRKYREVFILRHIEGLSTEDVAKILKIPEGTVKTYLHRARQELINVITDEGWGKT